MPRSEGQAPAGRAERGDREAELLEQALRVFSELGYSETGLQDIADRLGITRPLFYYYFDSKEALLWRLIGHLGDDLLARARPLAGSNMEPSEKLATLFAAHVELLLENSKAFRVYFAERHLLTGTRKRRITRGEHAYTDLVSSVIGEGQAVGTVRDGTPSVIALLALGLLNSTLAWYQPTGQLDRAEVARLAAGMAIDAVRSHPDAAVREQ